MERLIKILSDFIANERCNTGRLLTKQICLVDFLIIYYNIDESLDYDNDAEQILKYLGYDKRKKTI